MKMYDVYDLLPIMMISKKEVNNVKVNYEDYLIELLNSSLYFKKLTNSENFKAILEQSHGECDAKTSNYQIDFKLLVPTEFMKYKNKSLPNVDYKHLSKGVIYVTDNENSLNKELQIQASSSFANYIANICFTNKEKLINMKNDETILTCSIKNILVDKNILAFIPCFFNKKINCISIVKRLFTPLFSLRDDINKDTYITFLQSDFFYLLKYSNGTYTLVDKVHVIMVQTFYNLYRLTYFI